MPGTIEVLEATVDGLQYELRVREIRLKEQDQRIAELEQQVEELKKQATATAENPSPPAALPAFVKPNLPKRRRRRKPGRADGHEVALRSMPLKVDQHRDVPLTTDDHRRPICPRCTCRLTKLRRHRRIVEDLIRS